MEIKINVSNFCKEWINFKSWQHNYFMVEQYLLTTHCLVGSGESHCLVVLFNAKGNVPWGLSTNVVQRK
jgi:hypothetical protein